MSDPVAELNAVVARLVGKEIVGAEIWRCEDDIPYLFRLVFCGGDELHCSAGLLPRSDVAALSLDLIPVR